MDRKKKQNAEAKKHSTNSNNALSSPPKEESVGIVSPQFYTFDSLPLQSGETLESVTLAYETYGTLNAEKSNAVLIVHALSGDAHAAGFHEGAKRPGWWDNMIGPNKAFDTNRFFLVCSSVIGSCQGSTGPAFLHPQTQKPYALSFPIITIADMVNAQKHLIDHLGIEKLLCVAGGSMGGMQTLQWLVSYPERVRSAIPIATTALHSPQQIAFNEVGRQAIMADANWNNGNYYGGKAPDAGLALARMVGHITYMSEKSMEEKFGRQKRNETNEFKFGIDFQVESYLRYQGSSFVKRFDANAYLYISKALDLFDLAKGKPLHQVFHGIQSKVMVIAFRSDWLYPIHQSLELTKAFKMAGVDATYAELDSTYGHDSFLVETETQSQLIKHFIENVFKK